MPIISGFPGVTDAPVESVDGKTGAVVLSDTYQAKIAVSGILKGDGSGGVSAATAGTDYTTPTNVLSMLNRVNKVNEANLGYGAYMARGEALFSTETTPTVNGCIAWQYG